MTTPSPVRVVGITGMSGFIGRHVRAFAEAKGAQVIGFSRSARPGWREFSPPNLPDLNGLDALVHLAGENVLGRWTRTKKERILRSRVEGTSALVDALGKCEVRPRVLVCASAIGYYGNEVRDPVDETAAGGRDFLARVTQAWEAEAQRAVGLGVRVVFLRIGLVLGKDGGAGRLLRLVFRSGLGGPLGDGQQWMSCIHVDDVAGLVWHALEQDSLSGPMNAVMPEPAINLEFTRQAGAVVQRPSIFPAPAFVLRLTMGEMSSMLLGSMRVRPGVALRTGFTFRYPTLPEALRDALT